MYGEIDGFLETFKYALKFFRPGIVRQFACLQNTERQTPDKQFWRFARGRSLEELTDDDLDDDLTLHADALHLPKRVRLQFSEQWTEDLS